MDNLLDLSIRDKMIAKNYENIYRNELERYNNVIKNINNNYNNIKNNFEIVEKNRIYFIKECFDKYNFYMSEFNNEINNFINVVKKYCSIDICDKEHKMAISKLNQFKKNEFRLSLKSFIPFNDYYEKNKNDLNKNKYDFKSKKEGLDYEKEISNMDEKKIIKNFNDIIKDLLKKEEINPEKNSKLFDLIQCEKKEETWNILIDCLMNKNNEESVMKFSNLKNLEHLAVCLNYILLKENSIFKGNFELNVKIIFLAVKLFYQNEENNDKIYLSAILSKNKYLRTSQFWRNILEFKLANKICDSIARLNDVFIFKDDKKKGLFSKIGGAIGLNSSKNRLLSKTRILPLIKKYNELENNKVEILDKIATQEMLNLIKDNIPDMANFNFPTEMCLDLIAKLIDEYKVPKKNIKYLVIYTNVCSSSIRKVLRNEENSEKNKISNFKKSDGKIQLYKLLKNTIPYLDYEDYNKLLLCSKDINKKLKKKIYAHVLKQKDIDNKMRLYIWENILGVRELKKKYKYKEILSKANNEKTKKLITLDVARTSVNNIEKQDEIKKQLIDILCAISEFNNYYQGMQYIVLFLMELYGEEESFYLFLALLLNTEYSLLFEKNLQKLKVFFYVFKRIISLFEPELSSYLNINNMQVDLFLPPWFITLFAGTHHFLRKKEDNTPIIIRVLDYYILFGWKSMMSIGCELLHLYEGHIMKLDYEGLMRFLSNDILKMDFFLNENIYIIEKCMDEFKISKKLISNIEAEYSQLNKPRDSIDSI